MEATQNYTFTEAMALANEFKCPVCYNYLDLKKIFVCINTHLICENCITFNGRSFCYNCQAPYGETPAQFYLFEHIVSKINFPCKFLYSGCTKFLNRLEKEQHEEESCEFRILQCPFKGFLFVCLSFYLKTKH